MADKYDVSYPVIDGACAICVAWNYEEVSDTQVRIAPVIYRNDYSWDGDDGDGYFHEVLSPDSDGVSRTWYDISAARYEGDDDVKQIDSFAPRYYQRKGEDYYITLTLNWHDWYSHGQWSGSGYYAFTLKIPKATKPAAPVKADGSDEVVELVGKKDFKLEWQKPDEDSSYASKVPSTFKNVVIKRKDNGDKWNTVATLPGDATTYTDKSTAQGSSYAYRIYYHNGVKLSDPLPSTSSDKVMYTYPLQPSVIEAIQGSKDSTKASVRWKNDNKSANYDSQQLMKSEDGGSFTSASSEELSKATRSLDLTIDPSKLYRFKVVIKSPLKGKDGQSTTVESEPFIMWTKPSAPTGVSHSRDNDSTNTVTWSYDGSEKNLTGFLILRSENGREFTLIDGVEIPAQDRSFTDFSCRADRSYSYRVRATNGRYQSDPKNEVASETTLNTPKAPGLITGYMTGGSTVRLNIENTSFTANGTYIYVRRKNYTEWHLVAQITGKATAADIDVSAYPGPLFFKARNLAGELESEFSPESAEISSASQPDHPLIVEPINGGKATWSSLMTNSLLTRPRKVVKLRWRYVSSDGSPQKKAAVYLAYQKTSGTAQPETVKTTLSVIGEEDSVDWYIDYANGELVLDIGSEVRWGVKTMSESGEWNESGEDDIYSSRFTFCDRPVPSVSVTNTDLDENLLSFPICVSVTDVTDLARFDLRIAKSDTGLQSDAWTVFEKLGIEGSDARIGLDEFIPDIGSDYFVFVKAYDVNGFSNEKEATAHFATSASGVAVMDFSVSNDVKAGTASISIEPVLGSGDVPSRIILMRASDHETPLLDVDGGYASFTDRYAPINLEYRYRLIAFSEGGGFSVTEVENVIRSPYWFFMWDGGSAKGIWDCQDPWSIRRPDRTRKYYAGRKDPVSYDTGAVEITHKAHFWVESRDEAMEFYQLMLDGGRCVYKSGEGFVFKADVDIDVTPTYMQGSWYGEVECDITRISGGDL